MWSFVLWDGNKNEIIISNDRFGIKPLYQYSTHNIKIYFSEIKQIKSFKKEHITSHQTNAQYDNIKKEGFPWFLNSTLIISWH